MNKMKKVQVVSLPRSGHHLLADYLCQYFSGDLSLITNRKATVSAGSFGYCEYYNHCLRTPCPNPKTTYQKNHDEHLALENRPEWNYVIQYRDPIESLVSEYKLITNPEYRVWVEKPSAIEDSKKSWTKFSQNRILFWKKFVRKWIIENNNKNVIYVSYEELLATPYKKIKEVIEFVSPTSPVNIELLHKIIGSKEIKKYSNIKEFKYYDALFFMDLREKARDELRLLWKKKYNSKNETCSSYSIP